MPHIRQHDDYSLRRVSLITHASMTPPYKTLFVYYSEVDCCTKMPTEKGINEKSHFSDRCRTHQSGV